MTYYDVLGIPDNVKQEEICTAYRKLAKDFHPDFYKEDNEFAQKKMAEINVAYDTLKDRNLRFTYDDRLYVDRLMNPEKYEDRDGGKLISRFDADYVIRSIYITLRRLDSKAIEQTSEYSNRVAVVAVLLTNVYFALGKENFQQVKRRFLETHSRWNQYLDVDQIIEQVHESTVNHLLNHVDMENFFLMDYLREESGWICQLISLKITDENIESIAIILGQQLDDMRSFKSVSFNLQDRFLDEKTMGREDDIEDKTMDKKSPAKELICLALAMVVLAILNYFMHR